MMPIPEAVNFALEYISSCIGYPFHYGDIETAGTCDFSTEVKERFLAKPPSLLALVPFDEATVTIQWQLIP